MKVGILGAGAMGETVIGHLKESKNVTGIVCYDIRSQRVEELTAKGICATNNLDEILSDQEVKVVFITASNGAHHDLAIRALEAGKAVMCEKPMALSLADAQEMVDAATRLNGFLQIGFELRYSKLYTKIKDWIDAGLLGNIVNTNCYYIASAWPKNIWRNTKEACGGMFGEKLSHYVDLPRWWVNSDVSEVFSYSAPNIIPYLELRDNYHTTYCFANGAVSHLTFMIGPAAHFVGDPLQDMIEQQTGDGHTLKYLVVGDKGVAEAEIFGRTLKRWAFTDSPDYMISTLVENITWSAAEDHSYFHNTRDQTLDIVERVSKGLPPKISPADALDTMKLCFAAEQASETGKSVPLR